MGVHFIATKKNFARRNDGNIFGFHSQSTKGWYLDKYFEGRNDILERLSQSVEINPITGGDDYTVMFKVHDPEKVFGMNYKKIKYLVSDIIFSYTDSLKTFEDVSFWFVENTKTQWVDGVPLVTFTLACDIFTTFTNIIEQMSGQLYFKRKHFDRWVNEKILLPDGTDGGFMTYIPNFKNAPALVNCNTFCEDKNKKIMQPMSITETIGGTTAYELCAVIYYNVGLSATIDDNDKLAKETRVKINGKHYSIPYGLLFVTSPYDYSRLNPVTNGDTNLTFWIRVLQEAECTITGISLIRTTLAYFRLNSQYFSVAEIGDTIDTTFNAWQPRVAETKSTGGLIYEIPESLSEHKDYYVVGDDIFTKTIDDLLTDDIKPENEVHLTSANHTEIHLATPEKNAQILDGWLLFQNGNGMFYSNKKEKTVFRINWTRVFDVENGGEFGYLYNTSVSDEASYYTNRNFIDYTGQFTVPYKTDTYLEEMITRKNQKQSSYDNNDLQKQTAMQVAQNNKAINIAQATADAANSASGGISLNPFDWISSGVRTAAAVEAGTTKTIYQYKNETLQANSNYKQTKNTLDATYLDLANSPANVHTTSKVNGLTMLIKNFKFGSLNKEQIFDLKWFKNQINIIEQQLIAYDMNKYGYTCDWIQNISNFKTDIRTRRLWDYMEVINIKEVLQNIEIDPAVVDYIDGIFTSGVFIFNLDNWNDILTISFDKHNYELSLLSDFTLDS